MVIHFGQAERCLRQKSWKVAFELKNPESRKRHKFFRFVHVTGQEAFEFICIYMLRCKRRWYSANSPFRSMIGRVFLCTQTGRLRMQSLIIIFTVSWQRNHEHNSIHNARPDTTKPPKLLRHSYKRRKT